MKKLVLILLSIICVIQANAQIPGYLGKRFILGANLGITPVGLGLTKRYGMEIKGTIPYFNLTAGFDVDYTVSRRSTIGLHYGLVVNKILLDLYGNDTGYQPLRLTSNTVLFKIHSHRKKDGLVAPIGFMRGWSLGATIVNVTDIKGVFPNADGETVKGKYTTVVVPQVHYMFGYRRTITDKLLFTTSLDLGLFSLFGSLNNDGFEGDYNDDNLVKQIKRTVTGRTYKQTIINFRFGLSYLLF